jgi:hypothetical protein
MARWALFTASNDFFRLANTDAKKDSGISLLIGGSAQEITEEVFQNIRRGLGALTFDGANLTHNDNSSLVSALTDRSTAFVIGEIESDLKLFEEYSYNNRSDSDVANLITKLKSLKEDIVANGFTNLVGAESKKSYIDWYLDQEGYPNITVLEIH